MILDFSVGNFRSFHKVQTLNFRATSLVSEDKQVDIRNVVQTASGPILKTIGLYGPNGSGKSNLLKAFATFCRLVDHSLVSENVMDRAPEPFRLSVEPDDNAGYFQIQLILNGKKYRYGFTIQSVGIVGQEWLFGPAEHNETWYFKRTEKQVEVNREWFTEAVTLPLENLRTNTLFLTFVSSYNGNISQELKQFIARQISFDGQDLRKNAGIWSISGKRIGVSANVGRLTNQLVKQGNALMVLERLRHAGLAYDSVVIMEDGPNISEHVFFEKSLRNTDGSILRTVQLDLDRDESAGTRKFYYFIGTLERLFQRGGLLVSDEIDNNFHPSLLQQFIGLFNNPSINIAGAQVIFTTHDTNLLQPEILRRDQIYFTEKTLAGETALYSLADLKGIRNNADFARQYLAGYYGALPVLENY